MTTLLADHRPFPRTDPWFSLRAVEGQHAAKAGEGEWQDLVGGSAMTVVRTSGVSVEDYYQAPPGAVGPVRVPLCARSGVGPRALRAAQHGAAWLVWCRACGAADNAHLCMRRSRCVLALGALRNREVPCGKRPPLTLRCRWGVRAGCSDALR